MLIPPRISGRWLMVFPTKYGVDDRGGEGNANAERLFHFVSIQLALTRMRWIPLPTNPLSSLSM